MALRVVLVALVVAMGLELPDSARLASWDRSARGWVSDRMADLTNLAADDVPAVPSVEPLPSRADLAFEAASEAIASGFSSDLASSQAKPISAEPLAPAEPEVETVPEVASTAQTPRTERVSEAVRLTRQAVDAWASLIRPASDHLPDEGEPSDSL